MRLPIACLLFVLCFGTPVRTARAAPGTPADHLAALPVREVTIFKDGHAFVLRQGRMPTDADGNVLLDDLPVPILGTFWPFSDDKDAALASVVAGLRSVPTRKAALSLRDLLQANVGAAVHITEIDGTADDAAIVSIPASPPAAAPDLNSNSSAAPELIILHTATGDKALPLDRIRDVTFPKTYSTARDDQETRPLMTLNLDWKGKPGRAATVGMTYLQSGLRWLPSYKVTIDGAGHAKVQLEATLVNDLTDLHDVAANLVIGVPTFAAQDTLDPITLQQTLAQVSPYLPQNSYFNNGGSNAYMSQAVGYGGQTAGPAPGGVPNAPMSDAARNEDLFVFTVPHVTLRKGQRLVMPIAEYTVTYTDIYKLDLPFTPPPEVAQSLNAGQQTDLARQFALPHVMHVLRLCDTSSQPFTTAPALILRGGRVLAQGTMTYTSAGADADLEVTQALDIAARKKDRETKRAPNAETWNGYPLSRVDLLGTITLTNGLDRPAALEVTREVLGDVDTADHAGLVEMLDSLDDSAAPTSSFPAWWGWYNWPDWWGHFNGLGRITWKLSLPPQKSAVLGYAWHYFWR